MYTSKMSWGAFHQNAYLAGLEDRFRNKNIEFGFSLTRIQTTFSGFQLGAPYLNIHGFMAFYI